MLSIAEKKLLVGGAAFVVGVLFLRRALAGKGEVYIDEVKVQKTTWTPADDQAAALTALQRQAMEDLGVDLDLMAPTRRPTPMAVLEVEGTIQKLNAAGRTGEASFLATLLHEAQALPEGATT
jgi:hypothetical protein